jgi:hypothetical protein
MTPEAEKLLSRMGPSILVAERVSPAIYAEDPAQLRLTAAERRLCLG